jgi:protein-S-isoprenylcysteine O-methyltransferase Ste14
MNRIKLYPPLLALLFIVAMLGLHFCCAPPGPTYPALHVLGFALIAAGAGMTLWSAAWFRKNKTTIDPRGNPGYLAREGLYRFSRNPMYLGMLIVLLGVSLALGDWISFLAPLVFMWIVTARFIRHEEQALLACFGDDYRQYQGRVRRWF